MKNLTVANQLPDVEYSLAVATGPEKGTVYRLLSSKVSIGRGSDCDIVLAYDQKCSRRHAEIAFNGQGFEVRDVSDRNKIYVDGHETKLATLRENSVVLLGETELRFHVKAQLPAVPDLQVVQYPTPEGRTRTSTRLKKKSNPVRYVFIGVVLLLGYLLLSESAKKKAEVAIRTDEQIQADIAAVNALKDTAIKERLGHIAGRNQAEELAVDQAQAAYVRGFRDYRKGQYGRALESFQACLSIYPQHVLCARYLRLSQRKYNELIQYQMVLGRRYRDQQQYSSCAAAFQNVMYMIQDTNNVTFKEAKANFQACQAFIEERY